MKTPSAISFFACAALLSLFVPSLQAQLRIDTAAGGGPNNRLAFTVAISPPSGVAVDALGNVYFSSLSQHRVYKVSVPERMLTVVAGYGSPDFRGDGGPAVNAGLHYPHGLALNSTGTLLYIADRENSVVRRVNLLTGIITTVAGKPGISGSTGDGGAATAASLNVPSGVAVDSAGNLYIADTYSHRIRRVNFSDQIISTFAGSGLPGSTGDGGSATGAQLGFPTSVAVDASDAVFITDKQGNKIRRVIGGIITTYAGTGALGFSGDGGSALNASLNTPTGVAVDSAGNVFIADQGNQRVRKVTATTSVITTVAGSGVEGYGGDGGPAVNAKFSSPTSVAVNAIGTLFIADYYNYRVRFVTGLGIATFAGNGYVSSLHSPDDLIFGSEFMPPAAPDGILQSPRGVASDDAGNLYIADTAHHRVRRVDAVTGIMTIYAGSRVEGFSGDNGLAQSAKLSSPTGLAFNPSTKTLYISDSGNQRIRQVNQAGIITTAVGNGTGGFSGDGGPSALAQLCNPQGLAVDSSFNLLIAERCSHRIRRVAPDSTITTIAGTGTAGYSGDGGPAIAARLQYPSGIAVKANGDIYISDSGNSRVRQISGGVISTYAGTGAYGFSGDGGPAAAAAFDQPAGISLDVEGNLYVADRNNNRVRRIAASDGTIDTVAGTGVPGFAGDGGFATEAKLFLPEDVAVAPNRKVFIADSLNARVRVLSSTPLCTYELNATSAELTSAAQGLYSITVSTAAGCAWTASTDSPSWLPVTLEKNTGPGSVFFSVTENTASVARTGHLIIAGITYTVTQGAACAYTLSAYSANLSSAAQGPYSIQVTTGSGCVWNASAATSSWIEVTSGANRTGSGTVFFSVPQNTYQSGRMGYLVIAGQTYTVTQDPACFYALSADNATLSSAAQGPYSIQIYSVSGCAWTATSNASWLTIASNASSAGSGFTHFNVAANTGPARVGTLTVGGQTYTVTQLPPGGARAFTSPKVAVFQSGTWLIRFNADHPVNGQVWPYVFGASSDTPILGDWTNSGIIRMGVFRDGVWFLDINNNGKWDGSPTDAVAYFGMAGDVPVVGDWTGTGRMRMGVFRRGIWILDLNEDRTWNGQSLDGITYFGMAGDIPVVGDWNGTGRQRIGIFRNGLWVVDMNGNNSFDGADTWFNFGTAGDKPVIGDWTATGHRRVGIYRNTRWVLDTNGNNGFDGTDAGFAFGGVGDQPVGF